MEFTVFWLIAGHKQNLTGPDIATAFNNAGIGRRALEAVDFYTSGSHNDDSYVWDKDARRWVTNPKFKQEQTNEPQAQPAQAQA